MFYIDNNLSIYLYSLAWLVKKSFHRVWKE